MKRSNLTQVEAVSIAIEAAKRAGFHLENYKAPDPLFSVNYGFRSRWGYWTVGFESKVPFPDNTFTVFIDDQTRAASLTEWH